MTENHPTNHDQVVDAIDDQIVDQEMLAGVGAVKFILKPLPKGTQLLFQVTLYGPQHHEPVGLELIEKGLQGISIQWQGQIFNTGPGNCTETDFDHTTYTFPVKVV